MSGMTRLSLLLSLVFPLPLFSSPTEKPSRAPDPYVYPGWVHIQSHKMPSTQPAQTEEEEDPEANIKESEFYINKEEGAKALFLELPGEKIIRLFLPKQGEMMEYDSKHKGIAMGTMHPNEARRIATEIGHFSLTVDEMVKTIEESKADILETKEDKDGQFNRLRIAFMGGALCGDKEVGGYNFIWYYPKTRLIHKIQANFGHGDQEMQYTYLTKPIKNLYDLGAPRDSMILDSRSDPETKKLLDRLDRRVETDLGDYVAVLTQTNRGKHWGPEPKKMAIYLYGRQGKSAFYGEYYLNGNEYPDSPMLKVQGWPNPDLKQVLALTGKTIPTFYYATDGVKTCAGTFTPQAKNIGRLREIQSLYKESPIRFNYRLANHLWKGRDAIYLWGYGPQNSLITDKNHPGAIGLRLREGDFRPNAEPQVRTETIYWLDPNRDDLPREVTTCQEKFFVPNNPVKIEFKFRFLKFAQLPDKRWFPTQWEQVLSRNDPKGKSGSFSHEYHLQVFPNAKLDPPWYGSRVAVLKVGEIKNLKNIKEKPQNPR